MRLHNSYDKLPTQSLTVMEVSKDDAIRLLESRQRCLKRVIIIQWILLAVVSFTAIAIGWSQEHVWRIPNQIYSPALDAIGYKNIVYTTGFDDGKTIYQGPPTPENEQAWNSLFLDFGVSRIPRADAVKLINKTVPIPDYPGFYAVALDVFHQLHCLNGLRKHFWETNHEMEDHERNHRDHCIDSLRQSLMCAGDVSPISWRWSEKDHENKPVADTIHTCRDFDSLKEWALQHRVEHFDRSIFVEDGAD